MPIVVKVVSDADYKSWVDGKKKEMAAKADDPNKVWTIAELTDELAQLKTEQFNLRFQKATGQLENTARVRLVRRDIARLKTVIGEKTAS